LIISYRIIFDKKEKIKILMKIFLVFQKIIIEAIPNSVKRNAIIDDSCTIS